MESNIKQVKVVLSFNYRCRLTYILILLAVLNVTACDDNGENNNDSINESILEKSIHIDSILAHLRRVVSFSSYSDRAMNSAAMYQSTTQLGYYGYVTKNVEDLLSETEYPNSAYAPQDADLTFDPKPMETLNDWLQEHGHRILYIYGEQDPWAAPGVVITGKADALTMTLKGENHYTFITSFPDEEREQILTTLGRWLVLPVRDE